ncbi:uncharacterized protein LOC133202080 [Saccostrea echinata]|uniref:uncharacterized protein LOC133202080 n=1 Tax=Saccostrea echinata TaxID=191078 RepID=UPI002A83B709|nr:uncharacterized protein LOC133202080 [Saccostrea echinata]
MSLDLASLNSLLPLLVESAFLSSSVAVILIDWNHSFLESYLPQWRRRNIRQDAYTCLFGAALAIIYMNNFAINCENCRIAGTAIVVLLSFWLQSKTNKGNVSDKCVGTSDVPVSNKSFGGSAVTHRNQKTRGFIFCGAGTTQNSLSLSSSQFEEKQKDEEELVTPVPNLSCVKGIGINANRNASKLTDALKQIQMPSQLPCLDDSGLPLDDYFEESPHTKVEKTGYNSEDFKKLWNKCMESDSFHPSPEELREMQHDYKGIVQLERDVEEKDKEIVETKREVEEKDREIVETKREVEETKREVEETKREVEETKREVEEKDREIVETKREVEEKDKQMEETRQEMEETRQEMEETRQEMEETAEALEMSLRVVDETTQDVMNSQQALQQEILANQQKDQMIQQKDRMLNQKDSLLHQERQRVRELEQSPEGEWQRRLLELEEEIRRLSAQSNRSKCKICLVEEVQVSFTPCNHLISCQGCVDRLPERVCPICREPIQRTVNMFFA